MQTDRDEPLTLADLRGRKYRGRPIEVVSPAELEEITHEIQETLAPYYASAREGKPRGSRVVHVSVRAVPDPWNETRVPQLTSASSAIRARATVIEPFSSAEERSSQIER